MKRSSSTQSCTNVKKTISGIEKIPQTVSMVAPDCKRKNILLQFNDNDRRKLIADLNSPSASMRMRAITALKQNDSKRRYSLFDVPHEKQNLVTEEDKKIINQLPKTIQEVFKDTVAYVEVRSGDDDRTDGIKAVLRNLGAKIIDSLKREATVFVFKEGLQSSYNKAMQLQIPIVSVLWIEACRKHMCLVNTADFPITDLNQYEARFKNPKLHKRLRRPKSMTPIIRDKNSTFSRTTLTTPTGIQNTKQTANETDYRTPDMKKPVINNDTPVTTKSWTSAKIEHAQPRISLKEDITCLKINLKSTETSLATTVSKTHSDLEETNSKIMSPPASASWAKLLKNISKINNSCKKPVESSPSPVHLYETTPKPAEQKNRRRSLYTPNPVYEASFTEENAAKYVKRQTVFTLKGRGPEIAFNKTPNTSKHIQTPIKNAAKLDESRTKNTISAISLLSNSSHSTVSQPRPSTTSYSNKSYHFSQQDIHLKAEISINITATVNNVSKSTHMKRKMDLNEHETKENTPPKTKSFLTPSARMLTRQKTPLRGNITNKPVVQENKRRRTLFVDPYKVNDS